MGGGKTATIIALVAKGIERKRKNPQIKLSDNASRASLILVPDNLLGSWMNEIEKFTGNNLNSIFIEDVRGVGKIL